MIREQYPAIGGLQSPLFQQHHRPLVCKRDVIQVLHIQNIIWAVASTIGLEKNNANFYHPLYNTISSSTKNIIIKLLQLNDSVTVKVKNGAQQVVELIVNCMQ